MQEGDKGMNRGRFLKGALAGVTLATGVAGQSTEAVAQVETASTNRAEAIVAQPSLSEIKINHRTEEKLPAIPDKEVNDWVRTTLLSDPTFNRELTAVSSGLKDSVAIVLKAGGAEVISVLKGHKDSFASTDKNTRAFDAFKKNQKSISKIEIYVMGPTAPSSDYRARVAVHMTRSLAANPLTDVTAAQTSIEFDYKK